MKYIKKSIMLSRSIREFMGECLRCKGVVASWGMTQIEISDLRVSFYVAGFNYQGEIIVCANGNDLKLNSTKEYIGSSHTAIEAIRMLDQYIESNENLYRKLYESFGW